ncbi:FixH family protein [Virgibacillus ndiopensis]|uniref:FixH family protein n=1 Tax=Virgibacillus ndiopensis TaxID=2004408 RepID=UPI000C0864A2|nr:FixH family protein [Virgibacillus ndiopensis]
MRKIVLLLLITTLVLLTACGETNKDTEESTDEELKTLNVEFKVPETADVDETVVLNAIVTYGDEKVKNAEKVEFEFWEKGNEDDSTIIESKNNKDGTYTAEVAFDHDGVYEMYAHVTAEGLHTMPKKSITVGNGTTVKSGEEQQDEATSHEHGHHAEGFGMHFMKPENVKANQETDLTVHLQIDDTPLEKVNVRYEVWNVESPDNHKWIETKESNPGEYNAAHTFEEAGSYMIVIHVENEEGLHEHEEHQLEVN